MKRLKIYVAGPYTPANSDPHDAARVAHQNTLKAIRAGIQVIEKGHVPFIPHLTHFIHLETKKPLPAQFYYAYDKVWLEFCDAFLYLGGSKGADKELQLAKKLGLRIFRSTKEIPRIRN
ncbi:MAG: DUF1937 family protein [Candidatus Bathyarchaeia archaeon]|jgi:hypothetical protein